MSATKKRFVALAAIGVLALILVGLVNGAIGAALLTDGKPAISAIEISRPGVHLAPQAITGEHAGEALHGGSKFILTNTMLSSFIASGVLILLFLLGTSRMRLVPGRLQNFLETLVTAILSFMEGVVGPQRARQLFPIIATIFLFVLFNAWLGLIPIYQSLGFIEDGKLKATLLRPAGTDLNMPLALALVSFVFVETMGLRSSGLSYLGKFFRFGNLMRGRIFTGLIDVFVGILELLSEFIRIISFTFRLFGNMTAGEILLLVSAFLVSFVATDVFYALEILVGLIQAIIFAGLTLVFAAVAITPHEAEH
ncbi:MAG: F0F1 ATP synthase subunit A [Chloroflexi bacterium]|nr:F0F1 ATP synthase subunit A [Chloroflexota bacterium]